MGLLKVKNSFSLNLSRGGKGRKRQTASTPLLNIFMPGRILQKTFLSRTLLAFAKCLNLIATFSLFSPGTLRP